MGGFAPDVLPCAAAAADPSRAAAATIPAIGKVVFMLASDLDGECIASQAERAGVPIRSKIDEKKRVRN
jgi:hypothetical protein